MRLISGGSDTIPSRATRAKKTDRVIAAVTLRKKTRVRPSLLYRTSETIEMKTPGRHADHSEQIADPGIWDMTHDPGRTFIFARVRCCIATMYERCVVRTSGQTTSWCMGLSRDAMLILYDICEWVNKERYQN